MAILAKLIAVAGLAMSLAHATAPLSGFEHVISHVLDLLAERAQRPLAQHGTQVALATVLSTAAYRIFLRHFDPRLVVLERCYPNAQHMRARIAAAFEPIDPSGQVAAECWSDYSEKLELWHSRRDVFAAVLGDWPAVREQLAARARSPEHVIRILRAVGAPINWEQCDPPIAERDVEFAFRNAAFIRRRLTIGDMFVFLDWDRKIVWNQAWSAGRSPATFSDA